jgi:hypothetical protein
VDITLKTVDNPELLRDYIYLPSIINKGYKNFVPPFYKDEWAFHDPKKNKHLAESSFIRLLAYKNNNIAGRIMGIIYHPWNLKHGVKMARFYQPDCINDYQVFSALVTSVENWAINQGMNQMIGSFGFSDKDPQGIQVEGFEYPPVIASVSHQPHIAELVSRAGYVKFKDCVSYKMQIPEKMPDFYERIYERILRNNKLKLLNIPTRSALKPYFVPVMRLMNETYRNIFGFVAMDEKDINELASQYLSVLDPRLVKVVVNENDEPVAFVIAMANISKGIRKARGKLFPFGFIHILWEMKQSKQLDLLLGAVSEKYRGRGLNVMMGISLMQTARKLGMEFMDSHLILEENRLMRAELEKLGGIVYKRYRIFQKNI